MRASIPMKPQKENRIDTSKTKSMIQVEVKAKIVATQQIVARILRKKPRTANIDAFLNTSLSGNSKVTAMV